MPVSGTITFMYEVDITLLSPQAVVAALEVLHEACLSVYVAEEALRPCSG